MRRSFLGRKALRTWFVTSDNHRKKGGDSNKRGNRYEDTFAVFLLVKYAPQHILKKSKIRLKEQAGCPVDDFLLEEPKATLYHQLKADKAITWGDDFYIASERLQKAQDAEKLLAEARKKNSDLNKDYRAAVKEVGVAERKKKEAEAAYNETRLEYRQVLRLLIDQETKVGKLIERLVDETQK